jgi:hypothetical protein
MRGQWQRERNDSFLLKGKILHCRRQVRIEALRRERAARHFSVGG